MAHFSDRLKTAMSEHGYKQVDVIHLANEIGGPQGIHLGKSHMSQYCSGKTVPPQAWSVSAGHDIFPGKKYLVLYKTPPGERVCCKTGALSGLETAPGYPWGSFLAYP